MIIISTGGGLKPRLFAYMQLMRLPNCFTAMADVLAGFFIACGHQGDWIKLCWLLLSSAGFYAGGCVLNDLCDWRVDDAERPFRPIPSGRVSIPEAVLLCYVLLLLALFSAFMAGRPSFIIAFILLFLIASYDTITKHKPLLGPINMGACRMVNLLLGMSTCLDISTHVFLLPAISFVYVLSITLLSKNEVESSARKGVLYALTGWALVVSILAILALNGFFLMECLLFLGVLIILTAPPLVKAALTPRASLVGRAVKYMILAIPILDAVYLSGSQGLALGAAAALFAVPPLILSRYLYVT